MTFCIRTNIQDCPEYNTNYKIPAIINAPIMNKSTPTVL